MVIVMRLAGNEIIDAERLQREVCGIFRLRAAGSEEKTEAGVPTQAVIHGEVTRDAPRIFRVEAEALNILRKAAVACRSGGARGARAGGGTTVQVLSELGGIREIEGGVERKDGKRFLVGGERAAENRFVNEIHAEVRGVMAGGVSDVVAELILFLVAQDRERGDGRDELIVTERFKA